MDFFLNSAICFNICRLSTAAPSAAAERRLLLELGLGLVPTTISILIQIPTPIQIKISSIYIIKIAMRTASAAADRSLSWRNLAKIPLESNVLGVKNAGNLATAKKKQNA